MLKELLVEWYNTASIPDSINVIQAFLFLWKKSKFFIFALMPLQQDKNCFRNNLKTEFLIRQLLKTERSYSSDI